MDDIPAEQLAPTTENTNKGKEAATMKQGMGAVAPAQEKKGKGGKIALIAALVVAAGLAAVYFINKEDKPIDTDLNAANTFAYDSLIKRGDSLLALQDLVAAKGLYE